MEKRLIRSIARSFLDLLQDQREEGDVIRSNVSWKMLCSHPILNSSYHCFLLQTHCVNGFDMIKPTTKHLIVEFDLLSGTTMPLLVIFFHFQVFIKTVLRSKKRWTLLQMVNSKSVWMEDQFQYFVTIWAHLILKNTSHYKTNTF